MLLVTFIIRSVPALTNVSICTRMQRCTDGVHVCAMGGESKLKRSARVWGRMGAHVDRVHLIYDG
jgi:hypothetical protein